MLLAVKSRGKGGGDGRARAVGQASQAKADDAKEEGGAHHRDQRHGGRHDGEKVRRDHGEASARRVKQRTGEDTPHAIAGRQHTHEGRGQRRSRSRRDGEVARKADHRIAHSNQAGHINKGQPKRRTREHLRRGKILPFKALTSLGLLAARRREHHPRGGLAKQKPRDDQQSGHNTAKKQKRPTPADGLACHKAVDQGSVRQRGQPKAHKQTPRAEAPLIGEPSTHGRDDHVVRDADPQTRHAGIGDIEEDNAPVHEGGKGKAAACKQAGAHHRDVDAHRARNAAS